MTDVGPDDTSVNPSYRKALWQLETFDDRLIRKLRSSVVQDSGSGLNHGAKDEPGWEEAFWGKHAPRLKELKRKYDPDNRFNCWHCIGYEGSLPSSAVALKNLGFSLVLAALVLYYWSC